MLRTWTLIPLLWLFGCKPSPPEPPTDGLSDAQFIAVMIDVQLSEGMQTQKNSREREAEGEVPELYFEIFRKHNVQKDAFLRTYNYYKENPGGMEVIYEAVLDSLSKLEAEIKQSYTTRQKAERDSLNEAKRKNFESKRGIVLPK